MVKLSIEGNRLRDLPFARRALIAQKIIGWLNVSVLYGCSLSYDPDSQVIVVTALRDGLFVEDNTSIDMPVPIVFDTLETAVHRWERHADK